MKIFNWVHRKFHQKDGGFGRNMKKVEMVSNDADTEMLLEDATLVDMLGGWRDGILAIGTFGLDSYDQKMECPTPKFWEEQYEEEYEDYDDDDEDGECYEDDEDDDNDDDYGTSEDVSIKDNVILALDGTCLSPTPDYEVDFDNSTNLKYDRMERRERTTLADLFSADSDGKQRDQVKVNGPDYSSKKHFLHTKNGISFAKKLLPRSAEDSRPVQKLQRLMTKMLKRKIHPDIEGKIQKKDTKNSPNLHGPASIESFSLLQTPDVVV